MKMNLPNKLTLLRILLVPFIVVIPYINYFNEKVLFTISNNVTTLANIIVLLVFIIASLTDMLDGYLARKNNQVTVFGKLMDPLADKILVIATLIVLLKWQRMYDFVVVIIIFREFLVTGLRQIASANGSVISASIFGKSKTVSQVVMICYLLFFAPTFDNIFGIIGIVLITISCLLAIISAIDYFVKNKSVIKSM